jgi:hypothetical protein
MAVVSPVHGEDLPGSLATGYVPMNSEGPTSPAPELAGTARAEDPSPPDGPLTIEDETPWTWQVLPPGVIYHSYLAGVKEPRFASQWVSDKHQGLLWDVALGGRVGLVRYGTDNPLHPEGFEMDMEGAAFPRLNMEQSEDVDSVDFRFGVPLTYGVGRYQTKVAYYHICSHVGDEYLARNPDFERINYVRNAFAWGNSYHWTEDLRLYAEAAWAFTVDGGARPWEFQFGLDYSPAKPTGKKPVPFFAINAHLREEVDYGGNLVLQTGYQWRGMTNHLFRAGLHYYTGKSDQYEFFRQYEEKVGMGLWYDF